MALAAREIVQGVHHLNAGAGVYIIDRGDLVIVDTGVPGKTDRILAALAEIGRAPADVGHILITHYHQDHIGGLTPLAEATGAQVYVPGKEASLIRDGGKPPPMDRRGLLGLLISPMVKLNQQPPHPVHHEVRGGDEIDVAGEIRVIGCPGHTVGHVAYLLTDPGVLFVGDAAANLTRLDVMPLNEDFGPAEKSFVALAQLDFDVAGIAHGRQITRDAAARFRKAARRFS